MGARQDVEVRMNTILVRQSSVLGPAPHYGVLHKRFFMASWEYTLYHASVNLLIETWETNGKDDEFRNVEDIDLSGVGRIEATAIAFRLVDEWQMMTGNFEHHAERFHGEPGGELRGGVG